VGEILPCNQTKKGPMSATKVLLGNNGANWPYLDHRF
jgi:hypothetical protein